MLQASCGGAELACGQALAGVGVDLDVDLDAGESVLVVVDGTGAYELQVRAL